jgi:hypothetical protein
MDTAAKNGNQERRLKGHARERTRLSSGFREAWDYAGLLVNQGVLNLDEFRSIQNIT